jgi:membrane protein involved in colicin uptake
VDARLAEEKAKADAKAKAAAAAPQIAAAVKKAAAMATPESRGEGAGGETKPMIEKAGSDLRSARSTGWWVFCLRVAPSGRRAD